MATHLPSPLAVRELLEGLMGRDVTVGVAPPLAPGPATPASIGVYIDDAHQFSAVGCADLALSARMGACLGLLPVSAAQEAADSGVLDDTLRENLYEVFNIASALFNVPGADHVRLADMYPAGGSLPPEVRVRALTLGRRLDLEIAIAGYGSGRFSLVMPPG